jgi:Starch-binding associating with outer membrane
MKKFILSLTILAGLAGGFTGCKKFLDINSDPDTPQNPDPTSVLPAMLSGIPRGIQFDARALGRYTQNFLAVAAADQYDRHGSNNGTDFAGDIWRQTYFGLGQNLDYMIKEGTKKGQWQVVGAAQALKAFMFQTCTFYHGEMIFRDAFKENTVYFNYDSQETVMRGVDSICRIAYDLLARTDVNPASLGLSRGDYVYNGDNNKWRKFVAGLLARNFMALSNKPNFVSGGLADSVIKYADLAMANGADDFLIPFSASRNDDANFYGSFRNNMGVFKQSNFIVRLMDGTTFTGSTIPANRDPRIKHMLSVSQDTVTGNGGYRGLDPGAGDPNNAFTTGVNAARRVAMLWGDSVYANTGSANFSVTLGKYLFQNKAVMPVMTYSETQFMKAEAAFRMGNTALAYTAYRAAIGAHFDFINRASFPLANLPLYKTLPMTAAERTAYLAGPAVKQSATTLTLTDIMLQKYIALWGWGFVETWTDMRRYHYTDLDPITGLQVYKNLSLPNAFSNGYWPDNLAKPAYRFRPRFNSEYVWNIDALNNIGGLNIDYHTYEQWFSKP